VVFCVAKNIIRRITEVTEKFKTIIRPFISMKKFITFILVLLSTIVLAQEADRFTQDNHQNDHPRDPRNDQFNYVPNEVLVKFKDHVEVNDDPQLKSAGVAGVDQVLGSYGIESLQKLFSSETKLKSNQVVKDPMGRDMEIPSLHNIYKLEFPPLKSTGGMPINIQQVIEELETLPEVEYAEPNYIYTIGDFTPAGPEMTMLEALEQAANNNVVETATGLIPNDPLYNSQWGIPACNIDDVWNTTTGDSSSVIAILDTGVDKDHPDLKKNIWNNKDEIPGNGQDDDGNGFIDDVWGWDYINNDNAPYDDNSHGTHCAGIAAAVGDNEIGIAGVNWQAKIMSVKVFQSSGRGDASTIAQGINYAVTQGATVLSMSFGSYAESLTMRDALANAYASAVLVAASGNDSRPIGPCMGCAPMYPAAFSFVLGVEANSESGRASFSNLDQDGPTFSMYNDLLNYELKAPGAGIISCIPGGNYREYSGTSMAAPLVAGGLSLYRSIISREEETPEFMWVKLIQSSGISVDFLEALDFEAQPEIQFLNNVMVDTIGNDDADGRVDAGETIELWFNARNIGGQVDSVFWSIKLAEFEDTSTCKILNPTSSLGSISPYASRSSEQDPMKFYISNNVTHGRDITFDLKSWYKGSEDTLVHKFVITPENGEELSGILMRDTILTADKFWIINESLRINEGVTLTVMSGTSIEINKDIDNRGWFKAIGTEDSLIHIVLNGRLRNNCIYKYAIIDCSSDGINSNFGVEYSLITGGYHIMNYAKNSVFKYAVSADLKSAVNTIFNECSLSLTEIDTCLIYSSDLTIFDENSRSNTTVFDKSQGGFNVGDELFETTLNENSFLSVERIIRTTGNNSYVEIPHQYWGSKNSIIIKDKYTDFMTYSNLPYLDIEPTLEKPSSFCHAHVWKILVNGKDAQDEEVDPVGVGKQRFDVYFNRPMDTTITPDVSFGVRFPYSSNAVNEDGIWSEDGKIYTAYKTVKLTTGDGINRIRISGAKEIDGWEHEIPVEDMRFEFLIDAAGSASLDFMATPDLGKVALEWNDNDLEDGLGYNMYRMEHINDSVLTQPVLVNNSLITDTLYTDFSVVPNEKYYYYYKILRTNLEETDSSKVVAAVPFTADLGDANGDLLVNVSDIVTVVSYILENNPQPFIYEAGDVNTDETINVLDIVALVNLIMAPESQSKSALAGNAQISIEDGIVYVDSPIELGGIQFTIADVTSEQEVKILEALEGFEVVRSMKDGEFTVLAYSLSGKTIASGKTAILKINSEAWIESAVLSTPSGNGLNVTIQMNATAIASPEKMTQLFELGQNYPNPFSESTIIPFSLEMEVDEVILSIYDVMGREVKVWKLIDLAKGEHQVEWQSKQKSSIYIYNLNVIKQGQSSYFKSKRMIIK
jgi:subtilisin family serine protease/putative transposon-encoded protein